MYSKCGPKNQLIPSLLKSSRELLQWIVGLSVVVLIGVNKISEVGVNWTLTSE